MSRDMNPRCANDIIPDYIAMEATPEEKAEHKGMTYEKMERLFSGNNGQVRQVPERRAKPAIKSVAKREVSLDPPCPPLR